MTLEDESMEITTDPARWPFCEQRARERAAESAHPYAEDNRRGFGYTRYRQQESLRRRNKEKHHDH